MLQSLASAARSIVRAARAPNAVPARHAHSYARQDRGLYGGTHIQYGNNVPDSKTKTRRRWLPNVHRHSLRSDILNKHISLRIQTGVLRTIKKYGSLDAFLLSDSKQLVKTLGVRGTMLREEVSLAKLEKARRMYLPKVIKQQLKSIPANA